MRSVLPYLVAAVMGGVLIVLAVGVVSMLRGGSFNRRYGNQLMRARVALQAGALLLFVLLLIASRGG